MTDRRGMINEIKSLGIKPNIILGQNFLIEPAVYKKIISGADIKKDDFVLEIGPGTGFLTEYLLETGAKVVAVEKDKSLIGMLQNKFKNKPIEIIHADILKFDPQIHGFAHNNYKIVANIPYYLTSRLLRIIFDKWPLPIAIVLMVQYEVAKRITAKPPKMNLLALSVQLYSDTVIVSKVARGNFMPSPEVDSALIKIIPKASYLDKKQLETIFFLAKKAFSQKRKKIANSLKDYARLFKDAGIDPNNRPENLSLESWLKLTGYIIYRS